MSAGGAIAYHLRPNKAVDRQLFVELLTRMHGVHSIRDYRYIGFGGPFLDDFKLLHGHFGIGKLTSIESDAEVFKRQAFNQPLNGIDRRNVSSGDFIKKFGADESVIIWLDYTDPSKLREQIQEFETLLGKLAPFDVVKITLNARPDAVAGGAHEQKLQLLEEKCIARLAKLTERLGGYLPNDASPGDMTDKNLPKLLFRAVQFAAMKGRATRPEKCEFLTAFSYSDGMHTMLTVTGIILAPGERVSFLSETGIDQWDVALEQGKEPVRIFVPSLSTRERLYLDQMLPGADPKEIADKLGFLCEKDEEASAEAIASYARFYRHYPYFSRFLP